MPVLESRKDTDALTLTIVSQFDAPPERVWQLWADPRQLEQWWGPPTWPATFTTHEFHDGGQARYHMTGPDGAQPKGWWRIVEATEPSRIVIEDGFCSDDGEPADPDDFSTMVATLEPTGSTGTTMSIVTTFATIEQLDQMLEMGMEEGMKEALGQIDALLAA